MVKKYRALVAAMLAVAMVAGMASSAAANTTLKIGGSTTVTPVAVKLMKAYKKMFRNVEVTITETDSGEGRAGALSGKYDIGMSSSAPKQNELDAGLVPFVIGKDALTFIVHPKNKVKSLTRAQIQQIYWGEITNWKQVGGADAKINVYVREPGSGTGDYVKSALGGTFTSTAKVVNSNGLMKAAIAKDINGIGYVGMAYAGAKVRGLRVNGVAPTRGNARNGSYPFVRNLYFCTNGQPTGIVKSFIDYTLSPKGQALVNTVYIKR